MDSLRGVVAAASAINPNGGREEAVGLVEANLSKTGAVKLSSGYGGREEAIALQPNSSRKEVLDEESRTDATLCTSDGFQTVYDRKQRKKRRKKKNGDDSDTPYENLKISLVMQQLNDTIEQLRQEKQQLASRIAELENYIVTNPTNPTVANNFSLNKNNEKAIEVAGGFDMAIDENCDNALQMPNAMQETNNDEVYEASVETSIPERSILKSSNNMTSTGAIPKTKTTNVGNEAANDQNKQGKKGIRSGAWSGAEQALFLPERERHF